MIEAVELGCIGVEVMVDEIRKIDYKKICSTSYVDGILRLIVS